MWKTFKSFTSSGGVWACIFFYSQIDEFENQFIRLNDYKPDEDEEVAGIDRFEVFGFFNTCKHLAREQGKMYDEILQMPAVDVYMTLLHDFEIAEYKKDLKTVKDENEQFRLNNEKLLKDESD